MAAFVAQKHVACSTIAPDEALGVEMRHGVGHVEEQRHALPEPGRAARRRRIGRQHERL